MPNEDEGGVFRCAGVSGDTYSRPGSLVGEGIDTQKSKTRNCEDHHLESLEYPQKETEMPKEDERGVFRCAESICDAYSRPGSLVEKEKIPKSQKLENGDSDLHFRPKGILTKWSRDAKRRWK
jgi:hypothetical protein